MPLLLSIPSQAIIVWCSRRVKRWQFEADEASTLPTLSAFPPIHHGPLLHPSQRLPPLFRPFFSYVSHDFLLNSHPFSATLKLATSYPSLHWLSQLRLKKGNRSIAKFQHFVNEEEEDNSASSPWGWLSANQSNWAKRPASSGRGTIWNVS